MFKKQLTTLSLVSSLLLLTACQDSNTVGDDSQAVESKPSQSTSVNELKGSKILSHSLSAEQLKTYAEGEYFLAPLSKFSVIGLAKKAGDSGISDDGANYMAVDNLFEIPLKTMQLSFYYNSDDSRDKFNNIFGLWRSSYTSYMDFDIDYANANIKSELYDTARNACELGFSDIKENLYRGILSNANTVYDSTKHLCIIKDEGKELGSFNIFNRETRIDGDFHYLTKPSGEMIVFSKGENGEYLGDDHGVVVSMRVLEDGSYEYIGADSFVNTYSANGQLIKIMYEGQETNIYYDDKEKITHVEGPLDSKMTFNYAENESLESISLGILDAAFHYNDQNQLSALDIVTNIENNETNESSTASNFAMYAYNAKGLLNGISKVERNLEDGSVIPATDEIYTYDHLNRVDKFVDAYANSMQMEYAPHGVKRIFEDGTQTAHSIDFTHSKQQVSEIFDGEDTLQSDFNADAQLSNIELSEAPDVDVNGTIITQGLEDGAKRLHMSFAYNTKGLVNKIQYSSKSTGKKFTELEYKSRYPKPTKVLTNDAVTFFEYNQKGQLIKKTSLRFDKEMKLRANSITLDLANNIDTRVQKSYKYDENGFLLNVKDEVNDKSYSYHVDEHGKVVKGRLKKQFFFGFSGLALWASWLWPNSTNVYYNVEMNKKGWTSGSGDIDVSLSNVQTVFIGGHSDETKSHIVQRYAEFFSSTGTSRLDYHPWDGVDTFLGMKERGNPFKKRNVSDKLVVITHSWGGDSAVEATKHADSEYQADLLITVDPVGIMDFNDAAKFWIELYADAGYPYGGYRRLEKRCFSGWWSNICWPVWNWHRTMHWNNSDWLAYSGGKGWYSSYDPGDANPDRLYSYQAHHKDFSYMLWKMEHGKGNKVNNHFGIDDRYQINYKFTNHTKAANKAAESSFSKYPQEHGNWMW